MSLTRRQLLALAGQTGTALLAARVLPACSEPQGQPLPDGRFVHGVASGDPTAESVILWTRVSPVNGSSPATVEVSWEVALDEEFLLVVDAGASDVRIEDDYTLKLDPSGLSPATTYYFRFHALDETSPTGRTRTAPRDNHTALRFGLIACSCYTQGYFHAYRSLAQDDALDAILHVGDYIYEFATGEYGNVRAHDPEHEAVTLEDYRRRYAQYRRDPDLQEAHRRHPFIVTWDDHETANDSWRDGALNHMSSEGDWQQRKAAASRAYREWMPIREAAPRVEPPKLWRSLRYGDLAELFVLDTRIWGRDEPVEPGAANLDAENRHMLGADQETWLLDGLSSSSSTWKLLVQQIVFVQFPQIWNQFGWDGYPAARRRILNRIREDSVGGVLILSGDFHSSWASDVALDPWDSASYDPVTRDGTLATELVTPGATSPLLTPSESDGLARDVLSNNPHTRWAEYSQRGYVVIDVTAESTRATWMHIADVTRNVTSERVAAVAVVARSTPGVRVALDGAEPDAAT